MLKLLLILSIIILIVCEDEKESMRKCCKPNETLLKIVDVDQNVNYICFDSTTVSIFDDHFPLIFKKHYEITYGFPVYCKTGLIETEGAFSMKDDNYCVERITAELFNGTHKFIVSRTVTLYCEVFQEPVKFTGKSEIGNLRKCCPRGNSYDVHNHLCRIDGEYRDDNFLQSISVNENNNNDIYEMEYKLYCKRDQYIVELKQDLFSFSLNGSSLDIESNGGTMSTIYGGDWCIDHSYGSNTIVAQICTNNCLAFDAICMEKCCPSGQHYATRFPNSPASDCVPNENETNLLDLSHFFRHLKENNEDFQATIGLRSGLRCPNGKILMQKTDKHYLNEDGLLINSVSSKGYTRDFCFETLDNTTWGGDITIATVVCFEPPTEVADKFSIAYVTIPISCVFLGLTLLVYLLLPELRNLHGRTLICHVCVMLIGFACLARVQHGYVEDKRACTFYGYTIYFAFVSAFLWLNVMCFDIWWTFGSMRTMQPFHKKHAERRRFIWYSLYAWSLSFILTLTMFLMDVYPVADVLDANIGSGICWFGSIQNSKTDWPHYIFFVIPMGIVTLVNLALWVLTSRHCARVKSEVHRMQAGSAGDGAKKRFRADQAKYLLTVRLWVVMGAGWVWEIISTILTEPKWLWTIVDVINELQGVFIFIILVLKPKVFFLIRKKLGIIKTDVQKNGATSTRTSSTFLSRTISHEDRTNLRISIPVNKVK